MRGLKGGASVCAWECVQVWLFSSCPREKGEHLLAASITALHYSEEEDLISIRTSVTRTHVLLSGGFRCAL